MMIKIDYWLLDCACLFLCTECGDILNSVLRLWASKLFVVAF